MNELPAPPDVADNPQAFELLRVWVVEQTLHCSLQAGAFRDPSVWGDVLADVVRNVAEACRQDQGYEPGHTTDRILAALQEALKTPAAEEEAADEPGDEPAME